MSFPDVRPLSETAKNILQKRYFQEGEKNWKHLVDRVIDNILNEATQEEKELARQLVFNRYFILNSPALVNAGKKGAGLCACFVVDFLDDIREIYKTKLEFALIARKGGGCGTSLSQIRPEGSIVNESTHGYAGGPVKFADTISHDMEAMTQSGFRSMAIMFTMSVYHPDIIKFIAAKEEEGKISNANISVVVDDIFMQKVENNEKYWTEFEGKKYQQYNAIEIFNLIVEGAWRNGEPGVLFSDRINDSPYKYTDQKIYATNPCLFKDTLLLDGDTINKISERGNTWESWKTGLKQCVKLTTNAGHEIILTPDHKIMLNNGKFIESQNSLNKNIKWDLGNRTATEYINKFVLMGFLFGDGFICGNGHGISVKINKLLEKEIYDLLIKFGFQKEDCGSLYINKNKLEENIEISFDFLKDKVHLRKIPENIISSKTNECASFLKGLFEANGSVTKLNSQISLKATNKDTVLLTQILLSSFGISSWIVKNKPSIINWPNGIYTSKISYNLQIAPRNAYIFKEKIGFISQRKNENIKIFRKQYNGKLKVKSIEPVGEMEVWDFSTERNYELANGIVVHNCGEQPLPPNGVCNLGSIDLSKLLNKDNEIDYQKLETIVRLGIRFLDTVIDKTNYPTKEIETWAFENRPVGMGIMGFADLCLLKEIAYGSQESCNLLESIMSFIYKIAENESNILGQIKGVPKMCQKLPVPRRNITVTTIAPTGTVSLIAGCTSGIEPIFSEITIRNDKTGTYIMKSDLEFKPYFKCAVSSNGANEVTWEEHINVLASAQKYVDSGVSKTINFPSHTHRETIAKAIVMAWKLGCKGVAVYRNGSRKQEVLTPKNIKKDKCPNCGSDLVTIDNHKKCPNCSWILKEE